MDEKQCYSVNEVAKLIGRSRQSVIRLFEHEPGVLVFDRPEKVHKRRYRAITIPRAVLERVLRRQSNGGQLTVRFMRKSLC